MAREVTLVDAGLGGIASVERALIQVGGAVRVTDDPDQVARARMVVLPGQSTFGEATRNLVDSAMSAALRMVIERGDPFLGICLGMQLLFDGSDENGGQEGLHVLPGYCRRFPDGMSVPAEPGARASLDLFVSTDERVAEPVSVISPANDAGARAPALATAASAGSSMVAGEFETFVPVSIPEAPGSAVGGGIAAADFAPAPPFATATMVPGPLVVPGARPEPPAEPAAPLVRRLKVPHMGWNEVEPTGDHYYFVHSFYVEPERADDVMWMTTYGGIRFAAAVRRDNVLGCQFHPEKSQRTGLKFLRAFLLGGWG